MSKVAIQGNISGSGVLTIAAPNTNSDRTLTLPDSAGTIATAESTLAQFNASGSAPVYACRAWVNFNGTGTVAIRASGNVTSITDNGTGDYTVNFTTAMSDANYGVTCGFSGVNGNNGIVFYPATKLAGIQYDATFVTTSSIRCLNSNGGGSPIDNPYMNIAIFR
jgi:hypothetical protein